MSRPQLLPGPGSAYAGPDERILELTSNYGSGHIGGLISVRALQCDPAHGGERTLRVELYRLDAGVKVTVGRDGPAGADSATLSRRLRAALDRHRDATRGDGQAAADALALAAQLVAVLDGTPLPT